LLGFGDLRLSEAETRGSGAGDIVFTLVVHISINPRTEGSKPATGNGTEEIAKV